MKLIKADLFSIKAEAYAHGCNCHGLMGAGIAKVFANRFPLMYKQYKLWCNTGGFEPGVCYPWETEQLEPKYIFNLATQYYPGKYAKLDFIEAALRDMCYQCAMLQVKTVAMPMIGCGIGGLEWDDVMPLIKFVENNQLEITVCYL